MVSLLKTEAIILRKRSLLQKDVQVTLLTESVGKVTAIAKGVKNINSRRSPHLQTGNLVNLQLSQRGSIYYLQQSEIISGFTDLKKEELKLNVLYTFVFILDRLLAEQQQETELYGIAKRFLIQLARSTTNTDVIFHQFLQETLTTLGYAQEDKSLPELLAVTSEIINEKIPMHVIM